MKQLGVPDIYKEVIVEHFKHEKVSVSAVRKLVSELTIGKPKQNVRNSISI